MINFRKKKTEELAELPEQSGELELAENSESSESSENSENSDNSENTDNSGHKEAEEKFTQEAQAFAKGKGIEGEQLQQSLDFIKEIREMKRGEYPSMEVLEVVINGLDYDRAVAEARIAGELEGRNQQIAEEYMRPADSDGLPHLSGNGAVRRTSRTLNSIFDLAREA